MSILNVESLTKTYRTYSSEFYRVASWFGFSLSETSYKETITCRDVSFSVSSGEAVGIIGRNGAGKSTLLKMIAGTLSPTSGIASLNGRVSAILELGLGFNSELTGRQNVYHSAGLMGFSHEEIDAAISEVECFAEIGEYFDQPTRVYSSGMLVRVAFSVATMYRPDILIIDEALSVGDAYFQHKSFDRIKQFQKEGSTLLFVSHDQSAMQSLCDRVILLEKGTLLKDGSPSEVLDFYNALISDNDKQTVLTQTKIENNDSMQTRSGSMQAEFFDVSLINGKGQVCESVTVGENICLRARSKVNAAIPSLVFGFMIKDRVGNLVYGTNSFHLGDELKSCEAGDEYVFSANFPANLGVGSYSLSISLHSGENHIQNNYEWKDLALVFEVINAGKDQFVGSSWLPCSLDIESTNSQSK